MYLAFSNFRTLEVPNKGDDQVLCLFWTVQYFLLALLGLEKYNFGIALQGDHIYFYPAYSELTIYCRLCFRKIKATFPHFSLWWVEVPWFAQWKIYIYDYNLESSCLVLNGQILIDFFVDTRGRP